MQYTTGIVALALLLISCESDSKAIRAAAQESLPQSSAIQQLVQEAFDEVWSNLDSNSVERLHTADFQLLEHGEVWDNDSIFNYQRREKINMQKVGFKRTNRLEFLKTDMTKDMAWTSYHNYATWQVGTDTTGQAHWLESAVAVKTTDGWKLQLLHSTWVRE
jgi:hypothetical protein